ncbi:Alpha/Beta hydrolase protein [Lasiosphaeria miniovina]|uniref:Alpha/Beta hydrolase protein n=1 Tax=Lasiosphaeria miniovina TaxID=1954250 RepID=A0AA40AX63_9PEZI|nr:Alpha/Beta hydrolase protein [Lasiosphaeria miniovina]KAK0723600.1 Alpha/Beta hydrolase protein [Lasiosphaeria miniovina]
MSSLPSLTTPPTAPLQKSTHLYAVHQVPLKCDVYEAGDYPVNNPVFLFFHSGGLVCGSRSMVPPWLVQTCYQRKWPLVSASYRLLPQVDGDGLVDDARDAYEFARVYGASSKGNTRNVVVGGASAGFFLAAIIAHHLNPKPIALLSITGIPTFQHAFFNSSTLIPPEPIREEDVEHLVSEPISVGMSPYDAAAIFFTDKLLPGGARNPDFQPPLRPPSPASESQDINRGLLYDYYLYENMYPALVSSVDPGFEWAREELQKSKLNDWPLTVFIQGDKDTDVSPDVCADVAEWLGDEAAVLCMAKGQHHLFEKAWFLDADPQQAQDGDPMDAVRRAVAELDKAVSRFAH